MDNIKGLTLNLVRLVKVTWCKLKVIYLISFQVELALLILQLFGLFNFGLLEAVFSEDRPPYIQAEFTDLIILFTAEFCSPLQNKLG